MANIAERLSELVAWNTQNPGGDEAALAAHLCDRLQTLEPDEVRLLALPSGHASAFARFGARPRLLLNAHLDTVPASPGWQGSPLRARIEGGLVRGLGAADTKGAIAAILTALEAVRPRQVAVLFSGDEERAGSCMRHFLTTEHARGLTHAVVCEPTSLRFGVRHRGMLAFSVTAEGEGGHSSRADRLRKPVVDLARLAIRLDEWAALHLHRGPAGFTGMCMNLAEVATGAAFNVIPTQAVLTGSLRPPPGSDLAAIERELSALLDPGMIWKTLLANPPFATQDLAMFESLFGAPAPEAVSLDFWTEAAMLQAAKMDAVVFGPGDIASAHAPEESVTIAELDSACARFVSLLGGSL